MQLITQLKLILSTVHKMVPQFIAFARDGELALLPSAERKQQPIIRKMFNEKKHKYDVKVIHHHDALTTLSRGT